MKIKLLLLFLLAGTILHAQDNTYQNASQKMISSTSDKVTIGGYGQIDYNQPLSSEKFKTGTLDVHRLVLLFGYNFSEKTQFVTELEMEHVSEVYVEQAWINHRISNAINFRGGLMLIPMGIINEYHEPTTYNGVERPNVDKYLVPTTWREIGAGFNGRISDLGLNYQLYLVNGFNGYDGSAKLSGKNGLRSGRQKGAESYVSSPNVAVKADWNAISGLQLGLAGYFGDTQSTLYNGLDKNDATAKAKADSSIVGVTMLGLDGRYNLGNLSLRGQYIYTGLSNTAAYNAFTGSDVASALQGWYLEAAYSLFLGSESNYKCTPFVRYENYNTHLKVENSIAQNKALNKTDITFGASLELSRGVVLKADYQLLSNAASSTNNGVLNFGIGVWF